MEIKYGSVKFKFKGNLIASRKLFHIDHSSDMIDHLLG